MDKEWVEEMYERELNWYVAEVEECLRAFEYWNEMEKRVHDREVRIAGFLVDMTGNNG
jgi:hypothetical protein